MIGKKRNGNYWAVEFAGEEVRLCRFNVQGEQVEVLQCEKRPMAEFDFTRFSHENATTRPGEAQILCAVPRSEVLLKPFIIPRGEGADLRRITALKLEQSLGGLDVNTTLWGFMENGAADDNKRAHVLAAAIPRSYVEGLISQHFTNSERPAMVECGALAAVRAHVAQRPEPAHSEVVVDCAPEGLSLFVLKGAMVESAHFVPGNRSLEAAINEIRRLVLFLRGKQDSVAIGAVTCLGGETAERLAAELRRALDIPVTCQLGSRPSWISNPDVLPADWDSDWHRIVGLMQMVRAGVASAINFLATEAPRARVNPLAAVVGHFKTPFLALTLAVLLGATVLAQRTMSGKRGALMGEVIKRGREITGNLQHNEQALTILKRYGAERFALTKIMFEVATIAPEGVTLDTLTLNADGTMAITGRCQSYGQGQEFTRKLNTSDLFHKAEAPSLRRERDGITFKMTFALSPKARKAVK